MWAFVKSFATYRTVKMAAVIASALTLDSLSAENSTVTVVGTDIGQSDAGNWLVIHGQVYSISVVKPQTDRTLLTLVSPLDVFSRLLEFFEQTTTQTVGKLHRPAAGRALDLLRGCGLCAAVPGCVQFGHNGLFASGAGQGRLL